jgi:hypothetical protein
VQHQLPVFLNFIAIFSLAILILSTSIHIERDKMKFSFARVLVLALVSTEFAAASSWFSKAGTFVAPLPEVNWANHTSAYNKWHETELERWLSDHNIPYPTPADRKDLENLVKANWQGKVVDPVSAAGDTASDHYGNVKDWIFDR